MKRRVLSILLVLCVVMTLLPTTGLAAERAVQFAGGDGTEENPYQISTTEQLKNISNNLSANYILINNVDCSMIDEWIPLGDADDPFSGIFNGASYTISNLSISSGDYRGLFGYVSSSGVIKNLRTTHISANGDNCGGIVAGYNEGIIENCEVAGSVSGNRGTYLEISIGGIVGKNAGKIQYCSMKCESSEVVSGNTVGGIAGYNSGTIFACKSDCTIAANTESNGLALGGGIVGLNYGDVSLCKSTGTVRASVYYAGCATGGISGGNLGTIGKCYFNGSVSARATTSNYGGLAGGISGSNGDQWLGKGGTIQNCVYVLSEESSTNDICNSSSSYCGILEDNYNNTIDGAEIIREIEGALKGIDLGGTGDVDPDTPEITTSVYFLSNWDATTRTVQFGDNTLSTPDKYIVADSVDVSNIDSLLNKYVLVTMEQGDSSLEYTITDIQPVESKIGTVSATGEHSLTIDGTTYPVREDYVLALYDGKEVLYHVFNGTIMGFDVLEEKTGTLEAWDEATGRAIIGGTVYPTNFLSDVSKLNLAIGKKITYYLVNTNGYSPLMKYTILDVPYEQEMAAMRVGEERELLYWFENADGTPMSSIDESNIRVSVEDETVLYVEKAEYKRTDNGPLEAHCTVKANHTGTTTITVYVDGVAVKQWEIQVEIDRWEFVNANDKPGAGGKWPHAGGYYITHEDCIRLISNLDSKEKHNILYQKIFKCESIVKQRKRMTNDAVRMRMTLWKKNSSNYTAPFANAMIADL